MPTTFAIEKLFAATVAAVAALTASVTVWPTSLAAGAPASVIRSDEFSAPAAGRPLPIQYVLGPRHGRGLRRVPCAGAATSAASCYVVRP